MRTIERFWSHVLSYDDGPTSRLIASVSHLQRSQHHNSSN